MTDPQDPARCIRCSGPADELNEIEEGINCPSCAERMMESLPGIFHTPWVTPDQAARAPEADLELEG